MLLGLLGLLGGIIVGWLARRSDPKAARDHEPEHDTTGLTIVAPPDHSIQPCGTSVFFQAAVSPVQQAGNVVWEVIGDAAFTASGPTMQYHFARTGVYQVVARVGSVLDDVIVYAYKTPSGGTTLADLLEAEPGVQRNVEYVRIRKAKIDTAGESG